MKKLPKLKSAVFTTTLPALGKEIKFNGFTVKEEKLMLIAKESETVDDALNAIHQVVSNCIGEANNHEILVDDLSMVDITWLMIATRSKSVNDRIQIVIKDSETQEEVEAEINLDKVEIIYSGDKNDKITKSKVDIDGTVLILKYPGFRTFRRFLNDPENTQLQYEVLKDSLHQIATDSEVFNISDFDDKEIGEFIDSMPDYVPQKIKEFYDTLPELKYTIKYVRPSDKKDRTFVIQGFDSFFT